ncbi:response regulator transcription factor [Spongisporangium articulatum]|uniref:Response regulator transcription factor n=1 Tax=Spongisporangium articulatum TaxID=3362603 RepID=A0ABW8AJK7_9ACTN
MRIDLPDETGTQSARAAAGVAVPPVRVLIVDDQAPFRSVARTLVSLIRGWSVVGEAESGEAGVAAVDELGPQLVLMDINLPGINGVEATRRILAAHPEVTVVLVSTYAAEDLPADALSVGAAGYIRKEELTPKLLRSLLPS